MDKFAVYLDGADSWLFLDKCDDATPEDMESWWDDVRLRTEEMCAAYYAAERKYALEKDQEMKEEARAAAANSVRGGRHGSLLPSTDKIATYLDGADGWLFSDECDRDRVPVGRRPVEEGRGVCGVL